MKVKKSKEQVHTKGGIFITHKLIKQFGIDTMIDEQLGSRGSFAGYSYSDIIQGFIYSQHSGATSIEDIQKLRKVEFVDHPDFKICSPDVVLRTQEDLSTPTIVLQ